MSNEFQVGDIVRVKNLPGLEHKQGKTGEVLRVFIQANGRSYYEIKHADGSTDSFYERMLEEFVDRADNLDELIEQANALFPKLHARRDEIEIKLKTSVVGGSASLFAYEIFRAALSLPAPFTLKDSGYEVSFPNANEVKVGCQVFNKNILQSDLANLVTVGLPSCGDFYATRGGVKYKVHFVTWADAEQLLEALEKIKN